MSNTQSFTMPIVQTANFANIIQSTVACAERVFEVLDEEEEIPHSPDAKVIESPKGEVKFENVKFSYKKTEPLIEDMNLNVQKGETIAIVGPTGAGKTTLVNLLMRFYEINGGYHKSSKSCPCRSLYQEGYDTVLNEDHRDRSSF